YPGQFTAEIEEKIVRQSCDLALALGTKGLVNIQYLIYKDELYIIEANPRSSRTVPYLSKVSGVPMIELATRAMLGESISSMGYGTGLYKKPGYFAVKVPVFSFEKLMDVDTHLGPEMKSTGEVLGIASTREEAIFKGMSAAGWKMIRPKSHEGEVSLKLRASALVANTPCESTQSAYGVLFSVRETDLPELAPLAKKFYDLGFTLYATSGNATTIERSGMSVTHVAKVHENYSENVMTLLESGKVCYVVSTSAKGRDPAVESVKLRRLAVERDIDCLTAIDTANALADCLASAYTEENTSLVDITKL
ncbi:MAG: ATP-grasp domain-containing protein, partial [Treponema sp.]|nr:ATP-grasp domain-containing protein [Treponema sp.]